MKDNDLMEKIVSLCKRRGFVFPGSEIYGGLANSWDYGPLGVELKNNIKNLWWSKFVHQRDDIVGMDTALIMNSKVWEASGHVATFSDPLIECKVCHHRFRADQIPGLQISQLPSHSPNDQTHSFSLANVFCPNCKTEGLKAFADSKISNFNLMFRTYIGPVDPVADVYRMLQPLMGQRPSAWSPEQAEALADSLDKATVYLRPETAQGMFVNFKNILDTSRKTVPFGIAQIGPAFRNEITPGNFIFRTREFEQMEIEFFVPPADADKWFEYWQEQQREWLKEMGIEKESVFVEVPEADRAHYSKRSVDTEYKFPFGQKELYGLANRSDFDLKNHQEKSGQSLEYTDPQTNEKYLPYVIEPTWGVNRTILAVLLSAYREEEGRVYLSLPAKLAPYKAAVFPLSGNKPQLIEKAKEIFHDLQKHFPVAWDDRGNVGKRYYSQDEIGTPFCITVDFDTVEKDQMVTVRNRDTKEQPRIAITELVSYLQKQING